MTEGGDFLREVDFFLFSFMCASGVISGEGSLTALAGLCVAVGGLGQGNADGSATAGAAFLALALVESLAGDDAVDFCDCV